MPITDMNQHNNDKTIHYKVYHTKEHSTDHPNLTNATNTTKGRNALRTPYSTEVVKPAPKPYKMRSPKTQRAPNTPRKRKVNIHNPREGNPHPSSTIPQTKPTIKHSSVAQASPRINMVFPTPSVMPHRNPSLNTSKYKQTTLE